MKVAWWLLSWQCPEYFGKGAASHCCPSNSLGGRHTVHVGRSPWEADKICDQTGSLAVGSRSSWHTGYPQTAGLIKAQVSLHWS